MSLVINLSPHVENFLNAAYPIDLLPVDSEIIGPFSSYLISSVKDWKREIENFVDKTALQVAACSRNLFVYMLSQDEDGDPKKPNEKKGKEDKVDKPESKKEKPASGRDSAGAYEDQLAILFQLIDEINNKLKDSSLDAASRDDLQTELTGCEIVLKEFLDELPASSRDAFGPPAGSSSSNSNLDIQSLEADVRRLQDELKKMQEDLSVIANKLALDEDTTTSIEDFKKSLIEAVALRKQRDEIRAKKAKLEQELKNKQALLQGYTFQPGGDPSSRAPSGGQVDGATNKPSTSSQAQSQTTTTQSGVALLADVPAVPLPSALGQPTADQFDWWKPTGGTVSSLPYQGEDISQGSASKTSGGAQTQITQPKPADQPTLDQLSETESSLKKKIKALKKHIQHSSASRKPFTTIRMLQMELRDLEEELRNVQTQISNQTTQTSKSQSSTTAEQEQRFFEVSIIVDSINYLIKFANEQQSSLNAQMIENMRNLLATLKVKKREMEAQSQYLERQMDQLVEQMEGLQANSESLAVQLNILTEQCMVLNAQIAAIEETINSGKLLVNQSLQRLQKQQRDKATSIKLEMKQLLKEINNYAAVAAKLRDLITAFNQSLKDQNELIEKMEKPESEEAEAAPVLTINQQASSSILEGQESNPLLLAYEAVFSENVPALSSYLTSGNLSPEQLIDLYVLSFQDPTIGMAGLVLAVLEEEMSPALFSLLLKKCLQESNASLLKAVIVSLGLDYFEKWSVNNSLLTPEEIVQLTVLSIKVFGLDSPISKLIFEFLGQVLTEDLLAQAIKKIVNETNGLILLSTLVNKLADHPEILTERIKAFMLIQLFKTIKIPEGNYLGSIRLLYSINQLIRKLKPSEDTLRNILRAAKLCNKLIFKKIKQDFIINAPDNVDNSYPEDIQEFLDSHGDK